MPFFLNRNIQNALLHIGINACQIIPLSSKFFIKLAAAPLACKGLYDRGDMEGQKNSLKTY